jgi:hypothetical protein
MIAIPAISLNRRNKLAVVLAKARTHIAESIRVARCSTIFAKRRPVVMGPGSRQDNK